MPPDVGISMAGEPCCGVVVTAAAAGIPFATAWACLAEFYGPGWRGRTTIVDRAAVMYAHGVRWKHRVVSKPTTLRRWCRDIAEPHRRCVVAAGNHVMLINNDMVLDQGGIVHIEAHFARFYIVRDVLILRG